MEKVINGLVLNSINHKEDNKLLTILTNEGKILAICKGVNKAGSKLKNIACPFCFAEFTILQAKQNTIIGANVYDAFYDLTLKYENYLCGCAILDLLKNTIEQTIVFSKLFFYSINAIKQLTYSDTPPRIELLRFLINYLEVIGYKLNISNCANCGNQLTSHYLNLFDGSIVCENCSEPKFIKLTKNQIKFIEDLNFDKLSLDEQISLLRGIGNTIFCLINIKLKIEDLI